MYHTFSVIGANCNTFIMAANILIEILFIFSGQLQTSTNRNHYWVPDNERSQNLLHFLLVPGKSLALSKKVTMGAI